MGVAVVAALLAAAAAAWGAEARVAVAPPLRLAVARRRRGLSLSGVAVSRRGGAVAKDDDDDDDDAASGEKKESAVGEFLAGLPACTRYHLVGVTAITVIAALGVVDPETVLNLDLGKTFALQLWRPVTSALFLGPPSMGMATNVYLLYKYGLELERAVGTGAYAKFLALQVALLTIVAGTLGMPQTSASLVAAIIYACSRLAPFDDIRFQFGIKIKYWMLPFGLAAVDCLQQQRVVFFQVVWPRLNAELSPNPVQPLRPSTRKASSGRKLGD